MNHSVFLSVSGAVRIPAEVPSATLAALQKLIDTGGYETELVEIAADGVEALARFHYYVGRLDRMKLLRRSARSNDVSWATLVPISPAFEYPSHEVDRSGLYVLSRFAYSRRAENESVLESPLSHARIVLQDWRAGAVIHALTQPQRIDDLEVLLPGLDMGASGQLMTLMLNARMLTECNDAGQSVDDEMPSLQSWEFHDLLFHARSRQGRHDSPIGDSYRFAGRLSPPAVLKAPARQVIALHRPDIEQLKREDPPFTLVQERRRSIRRYGEKAMSARQLGEFLYRAGRVTKISKHEVQTPSGSMPMEVARRPYPGGGALYELEVYVAVRACEDLAVGFYRYDPLRHGLEQVSGLTDSVGELLLRASHSTGIPSEQLQVLLIIAARFQRIAWKYESMAYATILKDVGVLIQTMYLAATAMELAPCGIGSGDSDLFTRCAGTDYYAETSVGEFLLGSL
jgi:SagB-type dehydrogenase family enzyme